MEETEKDSENGGRGGTVFSHKIAKDPFSFQYFLGQDFIIGLMEKHIEEKVLRVLCATQELLYEGWNVRPLEKQIAFLCDRFNDDLDRSGLAFQLRNLEDSHDSPGYPISRSAIIEVRNSPLRKMVPKLFHLMKL